LPNTQKTIISQRPSLLGIVPIEHHHSCYATNGRFLAKPKTTDRMAHTCSMPLPAPTAMDDGYMNDGI
jgi:hypothetical protein